MKLVNGWHRVLLRSYSLWCLYGAGLLDVLPSIVPFTAEYIPNWASIVLILAAPVARIVQQSSLAGESGNAGQ